MTKLYKSITEKMMDFVFYQSLSENKGIEIELCFDKSLDFTEFLHFYLSLNHKTDHAGFHWHTQIPFGFFNIDIQDSRHWNYEENRWYNDGEEIDE